MQRTWCMTRSLPSGIAGAALVCLAIGCGAEPDLASADPPEATEHASDSILVRFRSAPDATQRRRDSLAAVAGTIDDPDGNGIDDRFARVSGGQLALVRLDGDIGVQDAIARLRRDPAVLYAEPNYIVRAARTPDDPRFGELYGLHNTGQTGGTPDADIDAPEAWDISVGSADVVVGVVDTGVDEGHEDLAANMFVNPGEIAGNGIDDDGNGVVDDVHGFNAIDGSGNATDDNGHGSHVSGTLGAVGDNATGITGVSWQVRIMALKFLSASGSGTLADAIAAIDYAVAQKNAGVNLRVLSSSWGGGGFSQALLDAIERRRRRRHPVRGHGRRRFLRQRRDTVLSGQLRGRQHRGRRRDRRRRRAGLVLELRRHLGRSGRAGREHPVDHAGQQLLGLQRHLDGDAARVRRRGPGPVGRSRPRHRGGEIHPARHRRSGAGARRDHGQRPPPQRRLRAAGRALRVTPHE